MAERLYVKDVFDILASDSGELSNRKRIEEFINKSYVRASKFIIVK